MKKILLLTFLFSSFVIYSQVIEIVSIDDKTSLVKLTNDEIVDIMYEYYDFDVEANNYNLKNLKIISDEGREIGKYGSKEIIFDNGKHLKLKLKKKDSEILILDKKTKNILKGKLVFNKKSQLLKKIDFIEKEIGSEIIESWVVLATLNKLYGSQNKELLKSFIGSAIFGATVGVAEAISR